MSVATLENPLNDQQIKVRHMIAHEGLFDMVGDSYVQSCGDMSEARDFAVGMRDMLGDCALVEQRNTRVFITLKDIND